MNLQIHRVLNDITGVSGLKILDAILAGERDPLTLARLCHGGVKNSEDTIAKSLEGDYRSRASIRLRQSLAAYRYYQKLVLEVDQEIKLQPGELKTAATAESITPARRLPHIRGVGTSQRHLIFVGNYTASLAWILRTCPGSAQSQPKPSCAKSVRMSPDSEMPLRSHPGWAYVQRKRSAAARFYLPRVGACEAELQLPCGWAPNLFTTPKTIWASFSAELSESSANPKPSQQPHISSREDATSQTSCPTRISDHPCRDRLMFLGSRLGFRKQIGLRMSDWRRHARFSRSIPSIFAQYNKCR